jgi:hypothetical protein
MQRKVEPDPAFIEDLQNAVLTDNKKRIRELHKGNAGNIPQMIEFHRSKGLYNQKMYNTIYRKCRDILGLRLQDVNLKDF